MSVAQLHPATTSIPAADRPCSPQSQCSIQIYPLLLINLTSSHQTSNPHSIWLLQIRFSPSIKQHSAPISESRRDWNVGEIKAVAGGPPANLRRSSRRTIHHLVLHGPPGNSGEIERWSRAAAPPFNLADLKLLRLIYSSSRLPGESRDGPPPKSAGRTGAEKSPAAAAGQPGRARPEDPEREVGRDSAPTSRLPPPLPRARVRPPPSKTRALFRLWEKEEEERGIRKMRFDAVWLCL
jgi:hypothetical protein